MSYLVRFPLDSGGEVVVEMADAQQLGFEPASLEPGEVVANAGASFERAIDGLLPAMRAIGERLQQLTPEEITISTGIKLTAEAGVIVAKAASEANFTVTLKWRGKVEP